MARYKIKDAEGNVVNTIIADQNFVEQVYPGLWEEEPEVVVPEPRNPMISKLDYMDRFTDAELAAIYTVAKVNIAVEVWLEKFKAIKDDVNLDDPRTISGLQAMEAAGLLAAGRAAEIVS